jgi:colanic acid/amylovoran biosynthesis glycosyltransferase
MRIAFLLYHWPVLSQTFIMNQVTGLIDRGHEVDVYAKSPGGAPVVHADVGEYGLLDRTFYYGTASERLPANTVVRLAKAAGQVIAHVHRKPMPLLRSLNFLKFGRAAASLGLFYKTLPFVRNGAHKHDIVYCHFGPNGNLAALLKQVGAITGRIVTTFHGEAGYTGQERYEKGYDLLFEIGDLMLPMSGRERQNLIELGCSPRKIVVHRMGVDMSKFAFALRQLRNDGEAHLLTVARLVEKKGVAYGIRAVANVLERYPRIEYKIAGDGPLRSDLENLIDTLDIGDQVKLLGWRRQEEIIELMKGADILLAPSVTSEGGDQEGIPVVLMEALAQGLPVLSTYHSGIPELVRDGESGFLVPERDADALAEKLAHLVSHPEIWPLMGKSGREYVERHYDVDKLNDRLAELFQRLLDGELS